MSRMMKSVAAVALAFLLGISVLALVPGASEAAPYEISSYVDAMDSGRAYAAVVVVDDRILVIGGGAALEAFGDPDPTVDDVLIYDIETGEQSRGAAMPKGVAMAAYAVGQDGLVYIIGGWNSSDGSYYGRVQVYDPVADSWELTATTTPSSIGYCASTLGTDGMIYIFGGGWEPDTTLVYDPSEDTFVAGTPMAFGMHGGAAIALSDTAILVAGGVNRTLGDVTTDAWLYNPVADEWSVTGSLNDPRNLLSLSMGRNGYVYALGGCDNWVLPLATEVYYTVELYDPETGEWSMGSSGMYSSRAAHGSVVDSYGRIWIESGSGTSSMVTVIEMMLTSEISGVSTLVFVSPTDGATVTGIVPVQVQLTNSYWDPLLGVDFYVDGVLRESQTYDESWVFLWDTTGLDDGSSHELMVRGFGWDGSIQDVSVTVTVSSLSIDEKLDLLESAIADLSSDLASMQTDVDSLMTQIGEIASDLEALAIDLAAMDSANAAEFASLAGQLDDLSEALTAFESSVGSDNQDLMDEIAALQDEIASLEDALGETNTDVGDVQTSVDDKMSAMLGYAVIGLLIVVILLLIVMMVMGRKAAPPPPAP